MRPISLAAAALFAVLTVTVAAQQEYVEFASRQDGFTIIFPTQPSVTQTTFKSRL